MSINRYDKFITEGRGISDVIKEYALFIYNQFLNKNYKQQLDFDYPQLPLMDLRVEFQLSNKYYAYYTPENSKIDNGKLYNIYIKIEVDELDIVKHKIIGIISHELTHINEYFNVNKRILNTGIKISIYKSDDTKMSQTWVDIKMSYKGLNIKETDYYYNFIYLLYLSIDTEMNARISQVYQYLYDFKSTDENYLFDMLKKHKNWEYLEMLCNFDSKKFVDECLNILTNISLNIIK